MWQLLFSLIGLYFCVLIDGNQLDVIQSDNLIYKGQKINESNLHEFLHKHEKELLFGDDSQNFSYKLVNVVTRKTRRRKRSTVERIINFNFNDDDDDDDKNNNNNNNNNDDRNLQLSLKKSENLIDDAFVYIERYENATKIVEDSQRWLKKFTDCFYRNENSAFDICDGNIRGVFHHNNSEMVIHPLPKRFGENSHVIFPSSHRRKTINNGLKFEPEIDRLDQITNETIENNRRLKRHVTTGNVATIPPSVLHIETAIFVDKDLFRHMAKNYPKNTEMHLIRFVLAMINGVQLLYHHPSLGHQINFVLKRLEILHSDPKDLRRSSDIDIFLNSFCSWQKKLNPTADTDVMHFDHAVILTGLDLYVVSKNGKISSQVVGLAPVAGMCTSISSCTINEGKHFESVFVVAHEIGHNLGMRHDTAENNCDPSLYIMSPTLGSGKITWSQCSRDYLNTFLGSTQARCLLDRGQFGQSLDHSAEGILPGERFDADQQCMLKYGKESVRSRSQQITDICRDLHCQRDRYTWTSHPALEGTYCGESMWCRSGICTLKATFLESYSIPRQVSATKNMEKANFIEDRKFGNLKQDYSSNRISLWNDWSQPTDCESGCLYGESGRLKEGSTGLKIYTRSCTDYRLNRKKCYGQNKKYEACTAKQCYNIARTTVLEFANQICERAKEFDSDIIGPGIQQVAAGPDDSCKVFCATKSGTPKTKSWLFPDGTTCRNQDSDLDDDFYCVNGRCEKFSCDNSSSNLFKIDPVFCPQSLIMEPEPTRYTNSNRIHQENGRDYKSLEFEHNESDDKNLTTSSNNNNNEPPDSSNRRNFDSSPPTSAGFTKSSIYQNWRMRHFDQPPHTAASLKQNQNIYSNSPPSASSNIWQVKSGCHFSCMEMSKGVQIVASKVSAATSIQLCSPDIIPCDTLQSTYEYATNLCSRYKTKVRGLSGNGMQISPSLEDPDRSCKVSCQDEYIGHRFYLVNGEQGHFPFGTKCSKTDGRYCIKGKCLEFGLDDMPLRESHINLAHFRTKRSLHVVEGSRTKRHYLYYAPINITERISQELLDRLIANFNFTNPEDELTGENIDLMSPVYLPEGLHHL